MDESDKERQKRERREQNERDVAAARKRRLEAQERSAWQDAMNEGGEWVEKYLEDEFRHRFGMSAAEAEASLREAQKEKPSDADIKAALAAIEEGKKKAKGGWISSGDKGASLKKNSGKIQKGLKKSKKGCLWSFAGLAAVGGATAYGMYEGISAVASALF